MDDLISRQAVLALPRSITRNMSGEVVEETIDVAAIKALPSAQPGCEDAVPRTSVEYICRKNTVSTNPYEHKYHDKFIQFMDDPEISDFGRWQHSNGFNTALVAVKCDLDKVPSVTPKQPGWIPVTGHHSDNWFCADGTPINTASDFYDDKGKRLNNPQTYKSIYGERKDGDQNG